MPAPDAGETLGPASAAHGETGFHPPHGLLRLGTYKTLELRAAGQDILDRSRPAITRQTDPTRYTKIGRPHDRFPVFTGSCQKNAVSFQTGCPKFCR